MAEKERIIESLSLALSRNAMELKQISFAGVDSPTKLSSYMGTNKDSDESSVKIKSDELKILFY